ncbi:hypothetical protein LCGC14_0758280 [marine sediment metagenome]|uniref:Uncharacterized protein n=1 Tax=marine sediment metagenome TaxID=412755 RepID=A0A0F9SM29_9ZZZZ
MIDHNPKGHKYFKKCWSCGSEALENKGTYVQCVVCDATWNPVPQPGQPIIETDPSRTTDADAYRNAKAYRPTKSLTNLVVAARAKREGRSHG